MPEPPVPPEAITDETIGDAWGTWLRQGLISTWLRQPSEIVFRAFWDAYKAGAEAAAPAIRADERDRIRQLADEHNALCCTLGRYLGTPFADRIGDDHA